MSSLQRVGLQAIIGDYQAFLDQLLSEVGAAGFDFADFVQMDHMCYRVSTIRQYQAKKEELRTVADFLGENQVNGRPISAFRLHHPVQHGQWRIDTIELPAPKPGVPTEQGLEHVEFVLFDAMDTFLKKHPDKQFNMKAATRGINPEVAFKLPTYAVKFHLLSLPVVVFIEEKLGITDVKDGQ